jgi:hypothetical protein
VREGAVLLADRAADSVDDQRVGLPGSHTDTVTLPG